MSKDLLLTPRMIECLAAQLLMINETHGKASLSVRRKGYKIKGKDGWLSHTVLTPKEPTP